jgi:hypothetical protein
LGKVGAFARKRNEMKAFSHGRSGWVCVAVFFLLASAAAAQQKSPTPQSNLAYSTAREVSIQGTVISYTNSSVAPLGPHVTLQTSSGVLDVHLGNARLLQANNLTLEPGNSVRVIGENVAYGNATQFVARLIQKGNQAVLLRSARGFPLRPPAQRSAQNDSERHGGAL